MYAVSDTGGVVTCLDAKTGAEVWQHRIGGGGHSASPLFADGAHLLLRGGRIGRRGSPRAAQYRELGRGTLAEKGVMATPAVADKAVFVRTESRLYRLEARP